MSGTYLGVHRARKWIACAGAVLLALLYASPPAEAWLRTLDPGGDGDSGGGVASDDAGNAFIGGEVGQDPVDVDSFTAKLSAADGSILWEKTLDFGGFSDGGGLVILTPSGDPVVAGDTGTFPDLDFYVARLTETKGEVVWSRQFDGNNTLDEVWDVAVDSDGDVLIAAALDEDLAVCKLSGSSGGMVWSSDCTLTDGGAGLFDEASSLTVDGNDDVLATAFLDDGSGPALTLLKLDGSDGTESWRVAIDAGTGSFAEETDVVADATAAVAVAGDRDGVPGGFYVAKWDANGSPEWSCALGGTNAMGGAAIALGLHSGGDIFAAGTFDNAATGPDVTLCRISASSPGGGCPLQWCASIAESGPDPTLDTTAAAGLAVDSDNNVFVAAALDEGTGETFAVFKFDGTNGDEICRYQAHLPPAAPLPAGGGASSVTADPSGDVISTGQVSAQFLAGDQAILAVKLEGEDCVLLPEPSQLLLLSSGIILLLALERRRMGR